MITDHSASWIRLLQMRTRPHGTRSIHEACITRTRYLQEARQNRTTQT